MFWKLEPPVEACTLQRRTHKHTLERQTLSPLECECLEDPGPEKQLPLCRSPFLALCIITFLLLLLGQIVAGPLSMNYSVLQNYMP